MTTIPRTQFNSRPHSSRSLRAQIGPFVVVPTWVLDRVRDSRALDLYVRLSRYVNRERRAWPKLETLAGVMGVSIRSVERAIATLRIAGVLETERRRRADGAVIGLDFVLVQVEPTGGEQPATHGGMAETEQPDTGGGLFEVHSATGGGDNPPPVAGFSFPVLELDPSGTTTTEQQQASDAAANTTLQNLEADTYGFLTRWVALYERHRGGVRYLVEREDHYIAASLVAVFDLDPLLEMAEALLTLDAAADIDRSTLDWILRGDRSLRVLRKTANRLANVVRSRPSAARATVWSQVLEQLVTLVPRWQLERWLVPTQQLRLEDGVLVVGAEDCDQVRVIEERYRHQITQAIESAGLGITDVRFEALTDTTLKGEVA